jgi:2-desacetyl-2-hydroxyethyl bacteriochlorophyllide A dehydrogenase
MNRHCIIFTGKNQLEIVDEPLPELKPGEILIETNRSMISTGTELICLHRNFSPNTHWDNWVKYPFHAGYLTAGRVIAVADDVKDWKVGDRAAARGNHASVNAVWANRCVKIPDALSDDEACWMGLGRITQVGARRAEQALGDDVVIIGLGLLGQLICQYARIAGAGNVIAIDLAPKRIEFAKSHGATHTLAMSAADALKQVEEMTGGRRADIVYDITGFAPVLATALPLARSFGKVILLGDTGTPGGQSLTSDVVARGVKIIGAHDGYPPPEYAADRPWPGPRMHELFFTYLVRGQMRVKDLITHRYKPDQARDAYDMLTNDRAMAMGVIFEWK